MKYGVLLKTTADSIWGELFSWCTDPHGRKLLFESREQAQDAAKALNQQTGACRCYSYTALPMDGPPLS